jgi:predicted TIM-barrel fold metal-dependent hydrolase
MTDQGAIDVHAHFFPEAFLDVVDMGYERPREMAEKQLKLKRQDRERILRGNAARLLGLA